MPIRTSYPAITCYYGIVAQGNMDTSMMVGVGVGTSNYRIAMAFVPIGNLTLSKIRVRAGKSSGTLGTSDFVCEIYASGTNGKPTGSALASSTTVSPAINSGGDTCYTFSGFSYALTTGTQYFAVFKNANGSPGSNNFYIDLIKGGTNAFQIGGTGARTWESSDGGSTWGTGKEGVTNINVEYSDGTTQGIVFEYWRYPGQGGYGVYGARECGVKFTVGDVPIRIIGGASHIYYTGAPTGNIRCKLYQNTTLIATSGSFPYGVLGYFGVQPFFFDGEYELAKNTSYRLVWCETTQSDASTDRYDVANIKVPTLTENRQNLPFGGTWQGTFFDGSSWTDSDNEISNGALILAEPFNGAAAGYSARGSSALNGGLG